MSLIFIGRVRRARICHVTLFFADMAAPLQVAQDVLWQLRLNSPQITESRLHVVREHAQPTRSSKLLHPSTLRAGMLLRDNDYTCATNDVVPTPPAGHVLQPQFPASVHCILLQASKHRGRTIDALLSLLWYCTKPGSAARPTRTMLLDARCNRLLRNVHEPNVDSASLP